MTSEEIKNQIQKWVYDPASFINHKEKCYDVIYSWFNTQQKQECDCILKDQVEDDSKIADGCEFCQKQVVSAEEFRRNELHPYDKFTSLTPTGIKANYKEIDAFAERYAQAINGADECQHPFVEVDALEEGNYCNKCERIFN